MTNLVALPQGTELVGEYRIQRVLGAGGFGITYLADEMALARLVTIKEYFPADFAARVATVEAMPRSQEVEGDYRWGLERFIDEAKVLARFDHPNIVRVFRYFKHNNTGYMVLNFEEGQSLKSWLKGLGRAPRQKELDQILGPLLDALELVHKADFLHRDIAPDNIIIRKDGVPVLIDFGAARGELAAHSKTVSALVKPGYSPYEQYAERSTQQGPWTDIYALGATLYHAVTGKRPPDSPSRMVADELVPAREAAISSYRAGFLAAIDKALALNVDARPQSVAAWRGDLLAPDPVKPGLIARAFDRRKEPAEPPHALRRGADPLPPPPDAPAPQGAMLDFVEELQRKPEAVGRAGTSEGDRLRTPAEPGAPTVKLEEPQPAPAFWRARGKRAPSPGPVKPSKGRGKVEPGIAARLAAAGKAEATGVAQAGGSAAATEKIRPARPRPMRGEGGGFRRLVGRLVLAGLVVGGLVLAVRSMPPAAVPTTSGASSRQAASASKDTKDVRRGTVAPSSQQGEPLEVGQLRGHRGPVRAVAYTADGRSIVSAGEDGTLRVWGAGDGRLARTIELDHGPANAIALEGRRALTAHADGHVVLWDIDQAQRIATVQRNGAAIWAVAFLPGGARFAAAGHDWVVSVWDPRQVSQPVQLLAGHESAVQAIAAAPQGGRLVTGSADKTLKLWNLDESEVVRTYRGHRDYLTAVALDGDGRRIASASLDGGLRIWSAVSSRLYRSLNGHRGRVSVVQFSPAGDLLASGGDDGTVRLWDPARGRTLRTLDAQAGPVRALAFSSDGKRLASAGADGVVRLWSAILGRPTRERGD